MRITEYIVGSTRERCRIVRRGIRVVCACSTFNHQIRLLRQLRYAKSEAQQRSQQTMHVVTLRFKLNAYSTKRCLNEFRFWREDLPHICELFVRRTEYMSRKRYRCKPLTTTCIVLWWLTYPCRYRDIDSMFGMHTSKICEMFWEVAQHAHDLLYPRISTSCAELRQARAGTYATFICHAEGALERRVGHGRKQDSYSSTWWYVYSTTIIFQWP